MKFTNISSAVILPLTDKSPSIEDDVFTTNPKFGDMDAVAEPLAILVASSESADCGILFNSEPSPLKEPLNEPVISSAIIFGTSNVSVIETLPLNSDFTEPVPNTLNVPSGKTDAVTEPVSIRLETNASSTNADFGILNSSAPLPLNILPLLNLKLPLKVEPLSSDSTTNPVCGSTEAVTLPLAINLASLDTNDSIDSCASVESAENGISNKLAPLPLNEPVWTSTLPLTNKLPLNSVVTEPVPNTLKNPSGDTDAVTEPVVIKLESNASSTNADFGILNKFSPLPLKNEPDDKNIEPLKVEPLSIEVTTNPSSGATEAVTEPDVINVDKSASSVNAERGISNKSSPLPLNLEPLLSWIEPLTNTEPLNSDFTEPVDSTLKIPDGSKDAVNEPVTILDESNASSVRAVLGMLNSFSPLPLNTEPDASCTSPKNVEPLSIEVTTNPLSGSTEAVTAPLIIKFVSNASSVNALFGILNKFSPLPLNEEPLLRFTFPLTNNEPLNSVVTEPVPNTLKNPSFETEAVTEPVVIKFESNASSVNALFGILNKFSPLPLKAEPLLSCKLPLIKVEPLNSVVTEPVPNTLKNPSGETEADTEPVVIKLESSASCVRADAGMLNKFSPLPLNEEPLPMLTFPLTKVEPLMVVSPNTSNEPVTSTEPVNSCLSVESSPNLFEPEENIIEDEIISTINSLATILLSTIKSPVTLTSPVTSTSPLNDDDTFTKNPVFGEIDADAEPDNNLTVSGRLFNWEPSPLNEPLKEPVTCSNWSVVTNKRLPSASDATNAMEPDVREPLIGTPKFGSASFNRRYSYLSSETLIGFTTLTFPLNNWLIYY